MTKDGATAGRIPQVLSVFETRDSRIVSSLGLPFELVRRPELSNTTPKSRRSVVTSSGFRHPTKRARQMLYCAQMGWLGPSTSLPEDFETWPVVLVVLTLVLSS